MTDPRQDGAIKLVPETWKLDHTGKFFAAFHKLKAPHKSFPYPLRQAVQQRMGCHNLNHMSPNIDRVI